MKRFGIGRAFLLVSYDEEILRFKVPPFFVKIERIRQRGEQWKSLFWETQSYYFTRSLGMALAC